MHNKIHPSEAILEVPARLAVLPLRDVVIFPHMVLPLIIGRPKTLFAVGHAIQNDRLMLFVAQKDSSVEEPKASGMRRIGVIGRIVQMLKLPNGLAKVVVEGLARIHVTRYYTKSSDFMQAGFTLLEDDEKVSPALEAARRQLITKFRDFVSYNKQIPDEVLMTLDSLEQPRRLADFVVMQLNRDPKIKQQFLEIENSFDLIVRLASELSKEIEVLMIEQDIEDKVKEKMTKSQRMFYLQEQLRTIRKELGEDSDDDLSDVHEYQHKIKAAKMSKEANEKASEEMNRLQNTPMMSPEATVIRTYLDWLISIPWHKISKDNQSIQNAQDILDEDHYGLEKPKERILEHLAVLTLAKKIRGPILCLVGPPGVGKTSLGKSMARALEREFVRVSLGGVRDEAEIRGHRRTYIGSMPGRIIQSMKKAGVVNPVFLLDEIDKMSTDFRGDPGSAMLEVLDPEQNHSFADHYLEVEYDLSNVLFVTTANYREDIPWALQDRMEIIELHGYLHQEKFEIAKRFLIPKQIKEYGLDSYSIKFTDDAVNMMIERYTREAGVRELERQLAKVIRKSARKIVQAVDKSVDVIIDEELTAEMLGVAPYDGWVLDGKDRIGSAIGLAWTATGGDLLMIEAEMMKGKGELTLTGQLGDVMQESARAALTVVRSRAEQIGFKSDDFLDQEVHLHFPEGAVSKDGPSAGITVAVTLASLFSRRPVRGDMAMTGEITLRGEVLPIGGLREKLMAALRAGVTKVIIPEKNKRQLSEVPEEVKKPLTIYPVRDIDEVFNLMLLPAEKKKRTRRTTKSKLRD